MRALCGKGAKDEYTELLRENSHTKANGVVKMVHNQFKIKVRDWSVSGAGDWLDY